MGFDRQLPRVPILVVRRGEDEVFRILRDNFRDPVIWDRRHGQRRQGQRRRRVAASPGRRRVERRRAAGHTWTRYGFVLFYEAADPARTP